MNLMMMTMVGIIMRNSTSMMGEMMLVMIMMGVGMMVEGITSDGYEEFIGVVAIRRFMSEEFGGWKWNHDTLAATIFTEEVYEIPERYRLRGVFLVSAPQFACLAWPVWRFLSLCPIRNLSPLY